MLHVSWTMQLQYAVNWFWTFCGLMLKCTYFVAHFYHYFSFIESIPSIWGLQYKRWLFSLNFPLLFTG